MKLSNKLKVCLMAFAFLFIGNTAIATNNFETEVRPNNSSDWELIKEEKGIQIFFKTLAKDGVFQLRIKFVNTKNEVTQFSWSLSKNSDSAFEDRQIEISPNGSVEKNEENIIPFNSGDSYNDFLIIIK